MPRSAGVLLVAALLLPAAAGAQTVAVADPQATVRGVSREDLAGCRELWAAALARTGLATVATNGKRGAGPDAEFVASLAVDRDGDQVVFTGLASRVRLDRWGFRHEARVPYADRAAWGEVLGDVAENLAGAVRSSPPRTTAQPPPRARVKLKHVAAPKAAPEDAAPAAPAPEATADAE